MGLKTCFFPRCSSEEASGSLSLSLPLFLSSPFPSLLLINSPLKLQRKKENLLKYNKITYISISVLNIGSKYGKIFLHIYKNASLHVNKGITALTWHYIN